MTSNYFSKFFIKLIGIILVIDDGLAISSSATDQHLRVKVPKFHSNDKEWVQRAAKVLATEGVVLIELDSFASSAIIPHNLCDRVNNAIEHRMDEIMEKIKISGVDPYHDEASFHYMEILSRDDNNRRFDVPVSWLEPDDNENLLSWGMEHARSVQKFHAAMDKIAGPVAAHLWNIQEEEIGKPSAGFLVNDPGSYPQEWHRDGPEKGFLNVFIPLIDVKKELGPTSLMPRTHNFEENSEELEPLLKKGECLIFDYRLLHRGQANLSKSTRRTLAYVVYTNRGSDNSKDVWNFPNSSTLKYY